MKHILRISACSFAILLLALHPLVAQTGGASEEGRITAGGPGMPLRGTAYPPYSPYLYPPGLYGGYSPYLPYPPGYMPYSPYQPINPNVYQHPVIYFFYDDYYNLWALWWDPYNQQFKWIPMRVPGSKFNEPPPVVYRAPTTQPEQETPVASSIPATAGTMGEVMRILPSSSNPRIVVRVSGVPKIFPVHLEAVIMRGRVGARAVEVSLADIRPGDQVTMQYDASRAVVLLRAQYKMLSGKAKSISGNTIKLETGDTISINPTTQIVFPDNTKGSAEDIHTGDSVTAQISPVSGRTSVVKVTPADSGKAASAKEKDDPITVNTRGPLRAGDELIVGFAGKAGGQARFTIPGVKSSLPMTEIKPGVYQGKYVVQPGDLTLRQSIKVTFFAPGKENYTAQSRRTITIQTIGGYLPRITEPHQGQQVGSPIVVRGIAAPDALIRVTIDYTANLGRVLPIQGASAVEEAIADSNGSWQTTPLPVVAPFNEDREDIPLDLGIFTELYRLEEKPVVFTITAASVGLDGEERASFSVDVTKKPGKSL